MDGRLRKDIIGDYTPCIVEMTCNVRGVMSESLFILFLELFVSASDYVISAHIGHRVVPVTGVPQL
jgi:hypothetical protein